MKVPIPNIFMHAILCPPISYACHAACIFTFFPDAISNESHNSGCKDDIPWSTNHSFVPNEICNVLLRDA